jgi:hypothetical protein
MLERNYSVVEDQSNVRRPRISSLEPKDNLEHGLYHGNAQTGPIILLEIAMDLGAW